LTVPDRATFACPLCGATARHRVLACRDHLVTGETFDVVECDGCGLRMTAPQPDPAGIGRYYESADYLPMTNDARGVIAAAYRAVRRVTVGVRLGLVDRHAPRPRGRLLDVGCGTGEFLAHARDAGWDVVGVEPADRAAAAAERLGIAVRRGADLARLDEAPFDAITLWHALEHMHAPAAQLAHVRRLLAPDGCVLVAVPSHDSVDARAYGAAWYAWDVPRHLWHFTPATLGRLLARQGLAVLALHALPFDPFYIALLSELRGLRRRNLARAVTIAVRSALAAGRDPARASAVVAVARAAALEAQA
jgi:SAM-dependent methyltransferase